MRYPFPKRIVWLPAAILLLAACASGSGTPSQSPSAVQGALTGGLIAYAGDKGVGVLDATSGHSILLAPLPAGGAFTVGGPVWGPAPGASYPNIYFTIYDARPAESRTSAGVVPYDWLFRLDPFTGAIEPLAASADMSGLGAVGLVANEGWLALDVGCCANYEVDALDLTRPLSALKVLAKPPAQAALFTEGAAPGPDGLLAVRSVGTGAWYWLNASADVLNPFPLSLGPEDGPIAISADGTLAAISLPDQGPVIEPINVATPIASAPATPTASSGAHGTPTPASPRPPAPPRHVNSKLPHADALAFSPDAKQLAVAVNGEVELYSTTASDGTPPAHRYLTGGNIMGVDWSGPLDTKSLAMVKPGGGPQPFVDALLAATKLPAAADTPAARPFTTIYMWQYDSTRSPFVASISNPTPTMLQQYPPLAAGVVYHHWAPSGTWALLGGCYRYRIVIAGSITPTAFTIGLTSNTPCNAPATPSSTPTK